MSIFANLRYGIGLAGWRPGESKNLESATLPTWGKQETRSVYDTSFGTPVTIVPKMIKKSNPNPEADLYYGFVLSEEDQEILATLPEKDQEAFIEFAKISESIPTVELITELVHYRDERERLGDPLELKPDLEPVNEKDAILFGIHFIKMRKGEKIIAAAVKNEEDPEPETQTQDDGETMTLAQALDEVEEKKRRRSSSKKKSSSKEEIDPAEAESPQE